MFFNHDYNSALIPSGIHFGEIERPIVVGLAPPPNVTNVPPEQLRIELCNPMQSRPIQVTTIEIAPVQFASDLKRKHKTKIITAGEFDDYAMTLTSIRNVLDANRYHAVIVPLRGALKAWLQLSVLGQHRDKVVWLPCTGASQREMDDQLRSHLGTGIAPFAEQADLRLAVVDTAKGGNGSRALAELLRDCHKKDARRRWFIDFHLIHQRGHYPPLSSSIPTYSTSDLHFNPYPWPVTNLILEDWSAAIGLEAVSDDGEKVVVTEACTEGKVIIQKCDKLIVVESPELHRYMDAQLGQSVSDSVVTDPALTFREDVWQRYANGLAITTGA